MSGSANTALPQNEFDTNPSHVHPTGSGFPTRGGQNCSETFERKSRTHSYDKLIDHFIEMAMERE